MARLALVDRSQRMIISVYTGPKDNQPAQGEATWEQLADALAVPRVADCTLADCARSECPHKAHEAWSPTEYIPGSTRSLRNVVSVHALVADIDHLPDEELPGVLERVSAFRRIVHASHSDRSGDRCLRVVLAVSRPVLAAEFPKFWRAAMDALGLHADEQAKDPSRLYYNPSRPSDACGTETDGTGYVYESADGAMLDVDAVLGTAPAMADAPDDYEGTPVKEFAGAPSEDKLAEAALALAAAWPTSGRHLASLALTGALARQGWPADLIATMVYSVCEAQQAGNGDYAKRYGQAVASIAKTQAHEPVAGWPSVEKILGRTAVDVACKALGVGVPEADPLFGAALAKAAGVAPAEPPRALTRADVRDQLSIEQRKLSRDGKLPKRREGRMLQRLLKGSPLVESSEEDANVALSDAIKAVRRYAPPSAPVLWLAELVLGSCPTTPTDQLVAMLEATPPGADRTLRVADVPENPDDFLIQFSGPGAGLPMPTSQHNVVLALRKLNVKLTYDAFADREIIERAGEQRTVVDNILNSLALEMETEFKFFPPKDKFYMICTDQAMRNTYHPVCDYLDSLSWDGVPRLSTWLIDYAGAADTPYTRAVSRLVLLAACRRVRQPGAKYDEMVILESGQGKLKSSALRILAVRDEWFTDRLNLSGDVKSLMEATAGKWICEAGELGGASRSDINTLKQYLSSQVDVARMAYARKAQETRRQFVIIGTTNDKAYLKDGTGNRRFWPIAIQEFDIARLLAERDQLWAEASYHEALGESIRLDKSLYEAAEAEQREREDEDVFEIILAPYLAPLTGKITITDTWKLAGFDIALSPPRTPSQSEQGRITGVLQKMGWSRGKRRMNGEPQKVWVRGTDTQQKRELRVIGSALQGWSLVDQDGKPTSGNGVPATPTN